MKLDYVRKDILMIIKVKKLHSDAVIPQYQTSGAAGFDLHSIEHKIIMPGETVLIGTGLAFEIPPGTEMQIRPRSGISFKTKIRVANSPGTIDDDFRGEVKIILDNTGYLPYTVEIGDRIAQGVLAPVTHGLFAIVEELSETSRGAGGFGSSGT